MVMQWNLSVSKIVALMIVLAKLHNFCIGQTEILERVPQMLDRDWLHVMNAHSGYVSLGNDDHAQQNTVVPTDLMYLGEHFNDVPNNILQLHCQLNLFQMIVDGHWQRPTRW